MDENLSTAARRRGIVALVLTATVCGTATSQGTALQHVSTVLSHARPELVENSAAAMSARQPGVFFTINDSGNEPLLFAMDTTGTDRGVWRVLGSHNADWESAAIGPCGLVRDPGRAESGVPSCIYIGDTGDNKGVRPSRRIYRAAEPTALAAGTTKTIRAERVSYKYSDGPHDVEAMYVAANGDIFLITKRRLRGVARQLRPALVFRLPAAVWAQTGQAVAELVDSLPIVPGSAPLRLVTDASLSPDGRHLAVRTYSQVYLFATDTLTGRVSHDRPPSVCDLVPLGEPQGEGVTWANSRGRLVFTSEGQSTPIHLADCPLPHP